MRRIVFALCLLTGCASLDGLSGGTRPDASEDTSIDETSVADTSTADSPLDADEADAPNPWKPIESCRAGWCFLNPKPHGWTLRSVWASGTRFYAVGDHGTFVRGIGGALEQVDTSIDATLNDLDGTSESDLWIVGQEPTTAVRFDGSKLSALPVSPGKADLVRVRVVGKDDVWIARRADVPLRWTGSDLVPMPNAVSRLWSSYGMARTSGAGFVVGVLGFGARFDGAKWVDLAAASGLTAGAAAYATSPTDLWSCAAFANTSARWNGSSWSALDVPFACWGIAGTKSADDVWLVGSGITEWNGLAFTKRDTPLRTVDLLAVSVPEKNRAIAVGRGGLVLTWDGSAWSRIGSGDLVDLSPASLPIGAYVLDADEVWVVGRKGALRWDGAAFKGIAAPPLDTRGCALVAKGEIACAGYGGIVRWKSGWTTEKTTPFVDMRDVDGSASKAWAVGSGGTIFVWDGAAWTPETSGITANLRAVFAHGDADAFAFADDGTVLRRTAGVWSKHATLPSDTAQLVRRGGSAIVRLTNGELRRFDGSDFVPMDKPAFDVQWIAMGTAGKALAGGAGVLARWDGTAWTIDANPPPLATFAGAEVGGKLWVFDDVGAVMQR